MNVTGNLSVMVDYGKLLFIYGNDHNNFNSKKEIKEKYDRKNSLDNDAYLTFFLILK